MLILTRRANESIIITLEDGRQIEVLVIDIKGDKARLGVAAERSITINRAEVQARVDAQAVAS